MAKRSPEILKSRLHGFRPSYSYKQAGREAITGRFSEKNGIEPRPVSLRELVAVFRSSASWTEIMKQSGFGTDRFSNYLSRFGGVGTKY